MNERMFVLSWHWGAADGILTGDVSHVVEFSQPWTFDRIKVSASNASTAEISATGGITIATTSIGDSDNPTEMQASTSAPVPIDADESITFTLDFNGAVNTTAAENVAVTLQGFIGEGPQ